jgi:hypothetical protein
LKSEGFSICQVQEYLHKTGVKFSKKKWNPKAEFLGGEVHGALAEISTVS